MAARNTVTVEFVAKGDLLDKLDKIARGLRDLSRVSSASSALDQLFARAAPGAARLARDVDRAGDEVDELARKSQRAGGIIANAFARAEGAAGRIGGFARNTASTALGFVAGNVVTAGLSRLEQAIESFSEKVISGGREAAASQRFLAAAFAETNRNIAEGERQALAFTRAAGGTPDAARRLFAQAALTLEQAGRPAGLDPDSLVRGLGDVAASRGLAASRLPELLRGLLTNDESLNALGLPNPSTLVEQRLARQGLKPSEVTEARRNAEILAAVMELAARNTGAAEARLKGAFGALEQISSLVDEIASKFGQALARNEGVINLLERARAALLELVSSDANFDAFAQRLADGFVAGATGAIDFAAAVARGVNEAAGFIERGQVLAEQAFLVTYATAKEVIAGIQLLIIDGLEFTNSTTRSIISGIEDAIESLLTGLIGRVRAGFELISPNTRSLIPGADAAYNQLLQLEQGLKVAQTGAGQFGAAFDRANENLARWRENLTVSAEEALTLRDRAKDLQTRYAEINRATADANKRSDKFFDDLKPGLAGFARFRPDGATDQTTLVTRLVEDGDTLRSVQVAASTQAEAASEAAAATRASASTMEVLEGKIDQLGTRVDSLNKTIAEKDLTGSIEVKVGEGLSADDVTPAGLGSS